MSMSTVLSSVNESALKQGLVGYARHAVERTPISAPHGDSNRATGSPAPNGSFIDLSTVFLLWREMGTCN